MSNWSVHPCQAQRRIKYQLGELGVNQHRKPLKENAQVMEGRKILQKAGVCDWLQLSGNISPAPNLLCYLRKEKKSEEFNFNYIK